MVSTSVMDNVDICLTLVREKGAKPPVLPLREELRSYGIEMIYNAKGTAQSIIEKKQNKKKKDFTQIRNKLERKLKQNQSILKYNERQKALTKLKALQDNFENNAEGITYDSYISEMSNRQNSNKKENIRRAQVELINEQRESFPQYETREPLASGNKSPSNREVGVPENALQSTDIMKSASINQCEQHRLGISPFIKNSGQDISSLADFDDFGSFLSYCTDTSDDDDDSIDDDFIGLSYSEEKGDFGFEISYCDYVISSVLDVSTDSNDEVRIETVTAENTINSSKCIQELENSKHNQDNTYRIEKHRSDDISKFSNAISNSLCENFEDNVGFDVLNNSTGSNKEVGKETINMDNKIDSSQCVQELENSKHNQDNACGIKETCMDDVFKSSDAIYNSLCEKIEDNIKFAVVNNSTGSNNVVGKETMIMENTIDVSKYVQELDDSYEIKQICSNDIFISSNEISNSLIEKVEDNKGSNVFNNSTGSNNVVGKDTKIIDNTIHSSKCVQELKDSKLTQENCYEVEKMCSDVTSQCSDTISKKLCEKIKVCDVLSIKNDDCPIEFSELSKLSKRKDQLLSKDHLYEGKVLDEVFSTTKQDTLVYVEKEKLSNSSIFHTVNNSAEGKCNIHEKEHLLINNTSNNRDIYLNSDKISQGNCSPNVNDERLLVAKHLPTNNKSKFKNTVKDSSHERTQSVLNLNRDKKDNVYSNCGATEEEKLCHDTLEIENGVYCERAFKLSCQTGRYQLFVTEACPWSHMCLVGRALKGLEDVVGVTYVKCEWKQELAQSKKCVSGKHLFIDGDGSKLGRWYFSIGDTDYNEVNGELWCLHLYTQMTKKGEKKVYTVPILWDILKHKIVSNTHTEILRRFNADFNTLAKYPSIDLYPSQRKKEIDILNEWIHRDLNVGVYKCGVASLQQDYDEAIQIITEALDRVESILNKQIFLTGDTITEADIRLFVTLIRFDDIYRVHFKVNTRKILAMPSLLQYVRRIYQTGLGIAATCDMNTITAEYYGSCNNLNFCTIIPQKSEFMKFVNQVTNQ